MYVCQISTGLGIGILKALGAESYIGRFNSVSRYVSKLHAK